MQKRRLSEAIGKNRRTFLLLVVLAAIPVTVSRPEEAISPAERALTFAERVSYQHAIEEVYWRHRIWPKGNSDIESTLDSVMSQAQIEGKVADYLRNSQALEDYWERPITAEQLQAEMDRMAQHSKQPKILAEVFAALGNDPFIIAECLARPLLADRLLTDWYAHDERIHGALRQRAEDELQAHPTVEQMKQLSGNYSEIELKKSDTTSQEREENALHRRALNSADWTETVKRLKALFNKTNAANADRLGVSRFGAVEAGEASLPRDFAEPRDADTAVHLKNASPLTDDNLPIGQVSALQEDEEHYYATAVISKTNDRLQVATVVWSKEPVESWRATAENELNTIVALGPSSYTLPTIASAAAECTDNTWTASSMNLPIGTWWHTAVWTGTEMIVWGGENLIAIFGTGGRYSPSTDTWTALSIVNAPSPRASHTAVWTGTEMIVWGGGALNNLNTGGRYNPSTDRWLHTAVANAPSGRSGHTAIWTGSQMIVWGGWDNRGNPLNTGGIYNPSTNTWAATSTTNAPSSRSGHSAIWTGARMIVWGGNSDPRTCYNTGGRYNPNTNSWTATTTTNAPISRYGHTAIWTGREMIIWGGLHDDSLAHEYLNTGGRYNPSTNSWIVTNTVNAPVPRVSHSVVWDGSGMIVWGGEIDPNFPGHYTTGGRYHPGTNTWTATNTTNAPVARWHHTAVWTGTEMIIWGGEGDHAYSGALSTGGRYRPSTNTWTRTSGNMPTDRRFHTGVWTGTDMIIWGGEDGNHSNLAGATNTGGKYHASTDSWTRTSITHAPSARGDHSAVWTGTEMIVWGGGDYFGPVNTGGKYNPITNSWTSTSTTNAPTSRGFQTAVWTGSQMIIWGGYGDAGVFNTGGKYNPVTNAWTATTTTNAPLRRWHHTAVWTDTQMIVWGGTNVTENEYLNTGGQYNPSTNTWTPMSTVNAPAGRRLHTAVWTGNEMIIWGGYFFDTIEHIVNTGGRYNPQTRTWIPTSLNNAPSGREAHSAVWTGREMIVWGADLGYRVYGTGGRFNPSMNTWTGIAAKNAATGRRQATAVWTGSEMIVWGGFGTLSGPLGSGGTYCAQ